MPIIDTAFLVIIALFTLFGFWFGLIHTLGSVVGFFAGIFVASRLYDYWDIGIGLKIFLFVFIFLLIGRLVGLLFLILNKAFRLVKIIPFTSLINRILGAALGFVEGIFVVVGAVFIVHYYRLDGWLAFIKDSDVVPFSLRLSKIIMPFLTKALQAVSFLS